MDLSSTQEHINYVVTIIFMGYHNFVHFSQMQQLAIDTYNHILTNT